MINDNTLDFKDIQTDSKKMKKKVDVKNLVDGISGVAKTEIGFQQAQEKRMSNINIAPVKKNETTMSSNIGLKAESTNKLVQNLNPSKDDEDKEKTKIVGKRNSKYSGLISGSNQVCLIINLG